MRHGHSLVRRIGFGAALLLLAPAAFAQNQTPLFVTANPAGFTTDALSKVAPNLSATTATFGQFGLVQSIESVAFSGTDAYATFDGPTGTGGLLFEAGLGAETTGRNLELGDRYVYGPATGLVAPRGLVVVAARGWVLVADTGPATAPAVRVFAPTASGNAAPLFTVSNLGTTAMGAPRAPWDVAYDNASDRLYVAGTDGVVAVFDTFSATQGAGGPSRTFTPAEGGAKISVNLHGIVYDAATNYLVLSDVGSATSATDGQVFVVANASTASGLTAVRFRNSGAATMLGNPVDIAVAGGSLYVAEKINSQVQRYDGVLGLTGSVNAAPNATLAVTNPESVDFTGAGALFAALNTPTRDTDAVVRIAADLSAVTATFGGLGILTSIESVTLGWDGMGVLTFDGRSGGGLLFVNNLAQAMMKPVGLGDRFIYGPATGLVMPKGLIGNSIRDWVLVADVGPAPAVRVFSPWASGNVAPLFVVSNLGLTAAGAPRAPWDIDYDTASDRLYVAGTDGVVAVFDMFSMTQGASGPSRTITPSDGTAKISVNLHGIDYVASADLLVLTDVGSAASATDGQLFTIASASTASGLTAVRFRNSGAATMLGNPVDVVTDGMAAYVAEKSNNMLQRYDGILGLTGTASTAPNAMLTVPSAESVAFSTVQALACTDPATEPMYAGGVVRNTAGTRTFIRVTVPTGGVSFMFYNTSNLVVGDPETSPNSNTVLTGFTRTGMTFTFAPAASPAEVFFPITTAGGGTTVRFFLRITDTCGRTVDVDPTLTVTGTETEAAAATFGLDAARPNPTSGTATIRFALGTAGDVRLAVYDLLGREVARLVDDTRGAGTYTVPFNGADLPAGLYVYRLTAEGRTATRTLTLAR